MAVQLIDSPFPTSLYNGLPQIDTMDNAAANNAAALKDLLTIIYNHKLQDAVSVHLVHKHYDLPEGRIMVYETVTGLNHPGFILSSPRNVKKCPTARGLYFKVIGNDLVAYEFTTDKGGDISSCSEFLAEFHRAIIRHGVQDIFVLTVKTLNGKPLIEFELPDVFLTVLINDASWLPALKKRSN